MMHTINFGLKLFLGKRVQPQNQMVVGDGATLLS